MWPYRPWLFQGQVPPNPPQGEPSTQHPSDNSNSSSSNLVGPSNSQGQTITQPQIRPQQASRDWTRRYQPSINSRVYGYPSTGGCLILPGYVIDLPYLGLNQFTEAKRSPNPMEEDVFCRRLRWLGAIWWHHPDADLDALKGRGSRQDAERAGVHVCVGWLPHGAGVWVLKYDENATDDNDLSLKAQRIGSLNMNDRCRMIEDLGGKFFKHPDDCEDLRWGNWPMQP